MSTTNIELTLLTIPLQSFISDLSGNSRWIYRWDESTASLKSVKGPKELLTNYNKLTLFALVVRQCCFLYLIIGKGIMDSKSMSLGYTFFTTIMWLVSLLIFGILYGMYQDRFGIVQFSNDWIDEAKAQLFTDEKPCRNVKNLKSCLKICFKELVKVFRTGKGDVLGIFITGFSLLLPIVQIFPPMFSLMEIGVFGQAAKYLYPLNERSLLGTIITRICTVSLATLSTVETLRTLRMFLLCMLVVGQIAIKLLDKLSVLMEQYPMQALKEYRRIYVIHNACIWVSSVVVFVTVQIGALITILTCTGTIVGQRLLNSQLSHLYTIIPVIAAIAILVAAVALPLARKTVERSEEMIRKWKRDTFLLQGKISIHKRFLRTLKPIGFPMVTYGMLDRNYSRKYWNKIMNNTIDYCLMVMSMTK